MFTCIQYTYKYDYLITIFEAVFFSYFYRIKNRVGKKTRPSIDTFFFAEFLTFFILYNLGSPH